MQTQQAGAHMSVCCEAPDISEFYSSDVELMCRVPGAGKPLLPRAYLSSGERSMLAVAFVLAFDAWEEIIILASCLGWFGLQSKVRFFPWKGCRVPGKPKVPESIRRVLLCLEKFGWTRNFLSALGNGPLKKSTEAHQSWINRDHFACPLSDDLHGYDECDD